MNYDRVDTSDVQVIYSIDPETPLIVEKTILVGQLLDVLIDVERPSVRLVTGMTLKALFKSRKASSLVRMALLAFVALTDIMTNVRRKR